MGFTQQQLASEIGVSKSAVAKWETDGGLPDRDNLGLIAEVLQVSVDDLHKVIRNARTALREININITPEVVALLEAYGYKVISPEKLKEDREGY